MKIALRAGNGRYVSTIAEGAGSLRADRAGIGPWEVFRLVVHSEYLTHGARVSLRTHTGRYVVAENNGGGVVHANADHAREWETFVIHREAGDGLVAGGDRIGLVAARGRLTVRDGEVRADGDASALFTLETVSSQLVHLQCSDGRHYLCAEGGGGGEVVADRERPLLWETFALVNRSNRVDGFHDGDRVNLRTWKGQFVVARDGGGGPLLAGQSSAGTWETFTLKKQGGSRGDEIRSNDRVALQVDNLGWVSALGGGGGEIIANRPAPRSWETFTLRWAEELPVPFDRTPSEAPVLATRATPLAGVREVVALIVAYSGGSIDTTLTPAHLRDAMVGDDISAKIWLERASFGNFSLAGAGVFGPITVPLRFSAYDELDPRLPLNASRDTFTEDEEREAQFELERLAGDGPLGHGDQVILRSFHDRYVFVDRGDYLFALPEDKTEAEPFVIRKVTGDGPISSTDIVTLTARDGQYVAALAGKNDLLKLNGRRVGAWEQFRLHRVDGAGAVRSSEKVALQSLSGAGQFVCADRRAFLLDVLNAAERAGQPVGEWLSTSRLLMVFDFSGNGNSAGSVRYRAGTTVGGRSFARSYLPIGLFAAGGRLQGADQLQTVLPVVLHELGHEICDGPERYYHRQPIRGDVVTRRSTAGVSERFTIERLAGPGPVMESDWVRLRANNGNYVMVDARRQVVNAIGDAFHSTPLQISRPVGHRRLISFKTTTHYLTAEDILDGRVVANRTTASLWEQFYLERVDGDGEVQSGDEITLKAHHDRYLVAEANQRTTDPEAFARGFVWWGTVGTGVGGGFDIMDSSHLAVMLCAYDRIRLGWIRPKVLTPEHRACYLLRPVFSTPEAIVLWDPAWPKEAYVLEQRRARAGLDEVPSEGIVVSWVNEDAEYWRQFLTDRRKEGQYPAVISAAVPDIAPNQMLAAPTLDPRLAFGRQHADAAFSSGRRVLPRGDGSPSRFELSFYRRPDGLITFCIQ